MFAALLAATLALGGCGDVINDLRDLTGRDDTASGRVPAAAKDPRIAEARSLFDAGRPSEGVALLRPLVAEGNREARFLLGLAYNDRRGVPKDETRALRLFESAARDGQPDSAYLAGLAHHRGRGTVPDQEQAARYLRQAADAGHAAARYQLGVFHQTGTGVARDPAIAAEWFRLAARQGFPEAVAALAQAYENGVGVGKDLPWAIRWHERAAAYGVPRSQFKTGVLIAAGRGLPADPETGLKWLLLAEQRGVDGAGAVVEAVRSRLPAEAVERAESAARAWTPRAAGEVQQVDTATVRYTQAMLGRLGFDPGPVDGLDGPRTRAAIARFRTRHGLAEGAMIDDAFLDALRRETAAPRSA